MCSLSGKGLQLGNLTASFELTQSTNIYLHTQHKIRLPTSGQKKEEVNLILPWKRVEAWHPLAARLSMLRWASGRRSGSQKMTQSGTLGCNLHQSRKHWAKGIPWKFACPNKQCSFETFMYLDLVLELKQSFLFQIFEDTDAVHSQVIMFCWQCGTHWN